MNDQDDLPPFRWLTTEDYREILDSQARELLGIDGATFLQRLDAGEYGHDCGEQSGDVSYLSLLAYTVR